MSTIAVDFGKTVGTIKPMHGVGQAPFNWMDFSMFHYLKEAGIPFSRLHDVGGPFAQNAWVDIPNVFRDFDADVNDPASYDFGFTDKLIAALVEQGVEPFYRLGVTIETAVYIKPYRIFPPKDYQKWAEICEHVIRHYTEGWADGFHYTMRYWEIWNEPDGGEEDLSGNAMWQGTRKDYFEMYTVAAKHLKACFPHLKIGGYASCGFYAILKNYVKEANSTPMTENFLEFFHLFLAYIKEHDAPLDFFSWHSYDSIAANVIYQNYAKEELIKAGYGHVETFLDEWNCQVMLRGTAQHAAITAGMMLALQDTSLDGAMFYDARLGQSVYGGIFDPMSHKPLPAYYALTAFNRLYQLGEQVLLTQDMEDVYAVAAKKDGRGAIVIANTTDKEIPVEVNFDGTLDYCIITDDDRNDQFTVFRGVLPKYSIVTLAVAL